MGILFLQISLARSQQLPARSLPCSIRGVALVGGDLGDSDGGGGFAAGDAAECQYECDRRANCNFWSHVQEWKVGRKQGDNSSGGGSNVLCSLKNITYTSDRI